MVAYKEFTKDGIEKDVMLPLSTEHHPEIPMEKARIESMGGTVEQVIDEEGEISGPYRVFNSGGIKPALAMSRSIGDSVGSEVGILPIPDFKEYTIDQNSEFMVLCSDGITEFMNEQMILEHGLDYYHKNDALNLCHHLTKEATDMWREESLCVDDITVIILFF